jgi:uncharacterized protein YdcH (DUF465 family)
MFSLVKKALKHTRLFVTVTDRVAKMEARMASLHAKLERFDRLADENEALWDHLDEMREGPAFSSASQSFDDRITDAMLRNMKTQGDA